jgi:hypothetical protein
MKMFLDDKLYAIAKSVDYTNWQDKSNIQIKMYQAVIDYILEMHTKLMVDATACDDDLFCAIKRCKIHWYNTLRKLEREGIVLFEKKEIRSFEYFISHHPLFKGFSDALLAYIK